MKIIVFKNGNTREITGEEGKYWLTGEDRVRKLSQEIKEIREIEVAEEAKKPEPAPVKKKAASKKKKAAEVKDDGDNGE